MKANVRISMLALSVLGGLAFVAPVAAADAPAIDRLGGFKGQCRTLLVAGSPERCARGGVVYLHLRNNRTIWMIGLADGRSAVAFIGEGHDGFGHGGVLTLSRVRAGADPSAPPVPVRGECRYQMHGDRPEALNCDAVDTGGRRFMLDFEGDGGPFDLKRF